MNDISQHIYLPIPSLKDQPRPGFETRDERLKAILANLDKQHQQVRNNIATAAISHHHHHLTSQSQNLNATNPVSCNPSPNPPDCNVYNDATFRLIANLSAPHDAKHGDPCLAPGARIPSPPSGVPQVEPPAGMKAAKETLDRIALYDQRVRAGREVYDKAAERRASGGGAGVSGGGIPHHLHHNVHTDSVRHGHTSDPFARRW